MPDTSVEYQLGFEAGYRYALTPRVAAPLTPERKLYAGLTLVIGVGSAAAVVASITQSKWRYGFAAIGVAGVLLGALIGTTRVLSGGPAPWEV